MDNTYVISELMSNEDFFKSQEPPCWVARKYSHGGEILATAESEQMLRLHMQKIYPGLIEKIEVLEDDWNDIKYCDCCEAKCTKNDVCSCGFIICRNCLANYEHGRRGRHLVRIQISTLVSGVRKQDYNKLNLTEEEFIEQSITMLKEKQWANKHGFKIMLEDKSGDEVEYTEILN